MAFVAALTALALSVAFVGEAYAVEPGESGSWNREIVGTGSGGTQQLETRGTVSEARNNGNLMEVWRGETNNLVWASINNGPPFALGGTATATNVSPTVVAWETTRFMVFHTGTDNHIYYDWIDTSDWTVGPGWTQVPNQTTATSVSVAQIGQYGEDLYMVYLGTSDPRIWGTFFDGSTWGDIQNISSGQSWAAPSITFTGSSLYVTLRGLDNQVWMATGNLFGQTWTPFTGQGGETYTTPTVAASTDNSGRILVSYLNPNDNRPYYRAYQYNTPVGDWSVDSTGWQTVYSVGLAVVGAVWYALLTGQDGGNVYWKQVYQP